MIPISRRRVWQPLLLTALVGPLAPSQAFAQRAGDPRAEQFVQVQAQRVLGILANARLDEAEKRRQFHQIIDDVADVPRITSFVLGKYARTITPAQRQAFAATYRTYAEGVYRNRLGDYHGERLTVAGSLVRKPGDVIVNTRISGGQVEKPLPVAWRVLSAGDGWKVIDIQINGVWLAITQQQDFVSTIDNAGGDVGVLIAQLQREGAKPGARR